MAAGYGTFEQAVERVAAASGIPRSEAMTKCARAYPDLLEKYQRAGDEAIAKAAAQRSGPSDAVRKFTADFERIVDDIAKRDGCSRSTAMQRARREHGAAFAAYQAAE